MGILGLRVVGVNRGSNTVAWGDCGARDGDRGDPADWGSGPLGLADVAAGRIDAYIELHINLWDVAAALAILGEAGAVVSAFTAGDGLMSGNPIFAAAPGMAGVLRGAVGSVVEHGLPGLT